MEHFTIHSLDPHADYSPMALPRVDTSYKIDEGYSEDTRSQDEIDSPMKLESGSSTVPSAIRLAMGSVLSLSEEDKSGTS